MKYLFKIISVAILVTAIVFSVNTNVYAKEVNSHIDCEECMEIENVTRANYGVQCEYCGEYDFMQYLYTEQSGMGGTTYIMYYFCKNCEKFTTVYLHARSVLK